LCKLFFVFGDRALSFSISGTVDCLKLSLLDVSHCVFLEAELFKKPRLNELIRFNIFTNETSLVYCTLYES